jgi:leucyl aminopeptidase
MRARGMGGILGVAQGSHQPPRLIHLTYRPKSKPMRRVALLGKGLTFDSGGLSLKTADDMETMKCDMAGSAAVLATLCALPEIGSRDEVTGIMGMAENMPGARHPSDDVLRPRVARRSGANTDAEGTGPGRLPVVRLDARRHRVGDRSGDAHGACVVALGPWRQEFRQPAVIDEVLRAASEAARPSGSSLYPEYREHIRATFADVKNTGIRWGRSDHRGALLPQEFVRDGLGHLDIAGPAFSGRNTPISARGSSRRVPCPLAVATRLLSGRAHRGTLPMSHRP